MDKMKIDEELKWLSDKMKKDGWWSCKLCSTDNWEKFHKAEETECPKTNKPRKEAEKIKSKEYKKVGLGNCFQMSVAHILGITLDEVPHFCLLYDHPEW